MSKHASHQWGLAAMGLLIVVAAILAYRAMPGSLTSASTSGEDKMSVMQGKSQVIHANDSTFAQLVLNSDVPVLVDFYAEWCGPCQRLAPLLEELAAETPDARIVKVNVDHSPQLAAQYGVDSIPSLKLFKNGAVADQLVGLASKNQLRALLSR